MQRYLPLCFFFLLFGLVSVFGQGRIAPLVPEEFYCNIVQHKWNFNAFNVNHTYSIEYYSSFSLQMIRADGIFGIAPNNASYDVEAHMQLSLLDYSSGKGINTYLAIGDLTQQMNCTVAPAAGWLPPAPKTFLRDIKAIWAGAEVISYYGRVQKWSFFFGQDTLITFYFTDDEAATFVRWDLVSSALQTGVNTYLYNLKEVDEMPAHLFSGSGKCPDHARQVAVEDIQPSWIPMPTVR